MMDGHPAADTRARRTAVDLAFGENADVAALRPPPERRPDEDRSVEKAEVLGEGMDDRSGGHDRPFYGHAGVDEGAGVVGRQPQAERPGLDVGIIGAAEGQVISHLADPGNIDDAVEGVDERRDVVESNGADPPRSRLDPGERGHPAGRRIDGDPRFRPIQADQPGLDGHGGQGDDSVAAHGAEPLVVDEEDPQVPVRRRRLGDDGAVHIRVAARLPHQPAAYGVQVFLEPAPLFQDGASRDAGQSVDDHPQRFAAGMGVDGTNAFPGTGRSPVFQGAAFHGRILTPGRRK